MKALVLAGGLGTRLRPLTETVPKPLVPLLNRPLVDHMLDLLPCDAEVVFTLSYGRDAIAGHLRSREDAGRFSFVDEPEPLGTGGAIRNARRHLDGTFLVMNGDIVTEMDVQGLAAFHAGKGGIGTISLVEVADPSRFGAVALAGDRITEFVEKPVGAPPSNWINAGLYILEADAIDMIPAGRASSIEREVFPRLVPMGLNGYRFRGLWTDVGTLESYLSAQAALLARMVASGDLAEPLLVADDAEVASQVVPPAVIGPRVRIGRRCRIGNCAIMEGAVVRQGATVEGAIVAPGAMVKGNASIKGAILGAADAGRP